MLHVSVPPSPQFEIVKVSLVLDDPKSIDVRLRHIAGDGTVHVTCTLSDTLPEMTVTRPLCRPGVIWIPRFRVMVTASDSVVVEPPVGVTPSIVWFACFETVHVRMPPLPQFVILKLPVVDVVPRSTVWVLRQSAGRGTSSVMVTLFDGTDGEVTVT